MDHVSANKSLPVTERENISGARVFDGEDQGKLHSNIFIRFNSTPYILMTHILIMICYVW